MSPFADVVFPLPLEQAFTYKIPDELTPHVKIGSRVIAPFGVRRLTGFVVSFKASCELKEVKDLLDCLDESPVISEELLDLASWIADYYLCSLGEAIKTVLPAVLVRKSRQYVEIISEHAEMHAAEIARSAPRQAQILRYVAQSKRISVDELKRRIGAKSLFMSLKQLERKGLIRTQQMFARRAVKEKTEKYVRLNSARTSPQAFQELLAELERTAPKQAAGLSYVKQQGQEVRKKELLKQAQLSSVSLKALVDKGYVEVFEKTVFRDYYAPEVPDKPPQLQLTGEQKMATEQIAGAIAAGVFKAFLLFGVTGSGKTQVYIEAIHNVLQAGKTAIVLVPEISLTPQTVARFRSHFGDKIAVLHSAMSAGERYDSWQKLQRGDAVVAIGPRSAIFAPVANLGLVVVDEEQEGSYKQTDPVPRYHARDIAVVRAKRNQAVVILGSATPSSESFYNARNGKYQLLQLKKRVTDVAMPAVEIIDMLKERRLSGKREVPVFSRLLVKKMQEKLSRNEQIILLLNRRGFSSFIKCKECGYVAGCEHCNITMTYHLHGRHLRCHYCGSVRKAPDVCPECQGHDIVFTGYGTQKVETELQAQFPDVNVVRMDLDTTNRKWAHDRILRDFARGKYQILLGTQMVAKGLDFNRVTLVGVINADVGLLLPDFRSTERTFQLLTQVAGRAGRRNIAGEVIIQTYTPESFCLRCAQKHDFQRFYSEEILARRELSYPPFGRLISIVFKGENETSVRQAARTYAGLLAGANRGLEILGPVPAPIAKIQNKYRYQILLKSDRRRDAGGKQVRSAVRSAAGQFRDRKRFRGVQIAVDVDPVVII